MRGCGMTGYIELVAELLPLSWDVCCVCKRKKVVITNNNSMIACNVNVPLFKKKKKSFKALWKRDWTEIHMSSVVLNSLYFESLASAVLSKAQNNHTDVGDTGIKELFLFIFPWMWLVWNNSKTTKLDNIYCRCHHCMKCHSPSLLPGKHVFFLFFKCISSTHCTIICHQMVNLVFDCTQVH